MAIYQPQFSRDGEALPLYISDETGYGHTLAEPTSTAGRVHSADSGDGDFGRPAWNQGQRNIASPAPGRSCPSAAAKASRR